MFASRRIPASILTEQRLFDACDVAHQTKALSVPSQHVRVAPAKYQQASFITG
jgi:hypothetical protein